MSHVLVNSGREHPKKPSFLSSDVKFRGLSSCGCPHRFRTGALGSSRSALGSRVGELGALSHPAYPQASRSTSSQLLCSAQE